MDIGEAYGIKKKKIFHRSSSKAFIKNAQNWSRDGETEIPKKGHQKLKRDAF